MPSSKKAMDVSKPGKVPADASARPLIVSHRPMVQDPMMKTDSDTSGLEPAKPATETKSSPTSGEKVIKPLEHSEKTETNETETNEVDKAAEAAVAPKDEPAEKPTASADADESPADAEADKASSSDDSTDTKPSSNSEAVVDAVLEQNDAGSKPKNDQVAAQEAAKQQHIQKLITDKKYFVKTGQVARRRNNRIAIVFLVLLLVVAGLYLAVDAKVVQPGFDVPIHVLHT